jgi:hypothetical protein
VDIKAQTPMTSAQEQAHYKQHSQRASEPHKPQGFKPIGEIVKGIADGKMDKV